MTATFSDPPLTEDEMQALRDAGYRSAGGGRRPDGVAEIRLRPPGSPLNSEPIRKTRAEWRDVIATLPPTPREQLRRAVAELDLVEPLGDEPAITEARAAVIAAARQLVRTP